MYQFQLKRECEVLETINIDLDKSRFKDEDEAKEFAQELAATHPYSSLVADRITCVDRDYQLVSDISFVESEEDEVDAA
jgi:hypothetical protein